MTNQRSSIAPKPIKKHQGTDWISRLVKPNKRTL